MKYLLRGLAVSSIMAVCSVSTGYALPISGSVWLNDSSNDASACTVCVNPADSTFTPGPINYDSNVGGYTVGGFVNDPTGATFSNPSVATQSLFNTHFRFIGTIGLNSGNNSFIVGHDDGLVMTVLGIGTVVSAPGPTGFTNTPFNVNAPSAGNYSFQIDYNECCGPPAELLLSINDVVIIGDNTTPVPGALPLFASGLGVFGLIGWRKRRKQVTAITA